MKNTIGMARNSGVFSCKTNRKTNREKSEINYIFTIIRNIYRSEKWKAPSESPETQEYFHVKNSKIKIF